MAKSEKQKFISNKVNTQAVTVAYPMAKKKPQLSQRDQYANAMNKVQRNGGSNGVGVGY